MFLTGLVVLVLAVAGPAAADDLSDANAVLCSSSWAPADEFCWGGDNPLPYRHF